MIQMFNTANIITTNATAGSLFLTSVGVVLFLLVLLYFLFGGGREDVGDLLNRLFPKAPLQTGSKADVYINGKYNRTATLSRVVVDGVFVYDKLKLPLSHRGRFYAIGVDSVDNSVLIYILHGKHRLFRYVRLAEFIRKVFNVMDDAENLAPDFEEYQELLDDAKEEQKDVE